MSENNESSFTTTITVNKTPQEAFDAINNARMWWAGEIEGETDRLGAEFTYRYKDMHVSTQKVTEFIPGKKVVWHVEKANISFLQNKTEWEGTDIVFEISEENGKTNVKFTHVGLLPEVECYDVCTSGWTSLITVNLKNLIDSGNTSEDPFADIKK
jgi:hypothetical protein